MTDNLKYTLKRSKRRSMGISVERDGSIIVRAPLQTEMDYIERFVSEKRVWIYQKLAKKEAINREKAQREFVNGQGFLYLGKSYRLKLIDNAELKSKKAENRKALRLWQGYFELLESETSKGREHFVSWYKKKLQKQLKARIPRYDKRIGVTVNEIRISDLGHRWASCGCNGVISFNWRSIMAPIWVFDYILVHEMAHKIERRHSKKFWRLVSRVIPDYEEYARWLSEHGADLDL